MKLELLITFLFFQQISCRFRWLAKTGQTNNDSYSPNTEMTTYSMEEMHYRLTRLAVQIAENAENFRSELSENNKRLQILEGQNAETRSALERLYADTARSIQQSSQQSTLPLATRHNDKIEKIQKQLEHLSLGTQLLVTAVRNVSNDIEHIKKNLSHVANNTNSLQREIKNYSSKSLVNDALMETKLRRKYEIQNSISCENRTSLPRNCKDLQENGFTTGIYRIQPDDGSKPFMVLCDMDLEGGGWTYIHNRYEGTQDFYLNWNEYKHGFGNLAGEFWLGLDHIYDMTGGQVFELLIELTDAEMVTKYARYSAFSIGSELEGFALKVLGGYEGNAGDSLSYHAGNRFSTKDKDQDSWPEGSCAQSHGGAWWYRSCDTSNLNGKYAGVGEFPDFYIYSGMYWNTFKGPKYSLLQARMLIKPRDEHSTPITPLRKTAVENEKFT